MEKSLFIMSGRCGMMSLRLLNLLVAVTITLVVMGLVLTGTEGGIFLAALSLPFVLLLPGYTITLALFPGYKLELAERVALSLGLSLSVTALSSLVLNWTAWGLGSVAWAMGLGSVTLFSSCVAVVRWEEGDSPEPESTAFKTVVLQSSFKQIGMLLLAMLITLLAIILALLGELTQERSAYTQFWMLPITLDERPTFRLGIYNNEHITVSYRVYVEADGIVILEESEVKLAADETWIRILTLPGALADATNIHAKLYLADTFCIGDEPPALCEQNHEVYREVTFQSSAG